MKTINKVIVFLLIVFFICFSVDIFFIKPENSYTDWYSDVRLFFPLILWLLIKKISHFTSVTTFKLVLIFLVIFSIFFIFFRDHYAVERLVSWIYIYLIVGVIQQLFEAKK